MDLLKIKLIRQIRFGGPGSGPQGGDGGDNENSGDNGGGSIITASEDPVNTYTSDKIGRALADEMHNKLKELGITDISNVIESHTDYGNSNYITIRGTEAEDYKDAIKIRISDHSVTNIGRMFGEVHVNVKNIGNQLYAIEKTRHPERFEPKKFTIKTTNKVTNLQQGLLRPTDKIISERTTPKGNKVYEVDRETITNGTILQRKK